MVVENVAPSLSRVTHPKTGEVSLNNFRLGRNAPSQQQLIPRLSEKAVEDRSRCLPADGCHPRPASLTYSTADNLAEICRDIGCDEDFQEEIVATLVSGRQQPRAEQVRDVLWANAASEGATRGSSNMKDPPKPLQVNQRPAAQDARPAANNPAIGPSNIAPKVG
jgi:hypothetical protein